MYGTKFTFKLQSSVNFTSGKIQIEHAMYHPYP